ncbi:MAG: hypothetical protein Q7U47_09300, partial [Paludibacter sp.]|nr:hypothetical protein [Paludibacter sp.]
LTFSNAGVKTFPSGTTGITGNFTISDAATGDAIANNTTINYNGSGAQNAGAINYNNLTFSNAGVKTFSAGTTGIAGIFTISGTATGDATTNNTTINYNGSGAQNAGTINYNNLTFSNAGVKTFPAGTTGIAGVFTISGTATGDATTNNTTINYNGSGAQTVIAINYYNLTISGARKKNNVIFAPSGTIGIAGYLSTAATFTSGSYVVTGSTINFNGIVSQTIAGIPDTPFNNLTISNPNFPVLATANLRVNGVLTLNGNLASGDMAMDSNTLTMGASATTAGTGDVTGIVKRTTINPNVAYSFGSEFTTIIFPLVGTLPTEMSVKITIGSVPSWKTDAITRYYDIIRVGGSGFKATVKLRYLDSELNGNTETGLVFWHRNASDTDIHEHGKSSFNATENWVELSNIISFPTTYGNYSQWTLANTRAVQIVWLGTYSTDWEAPQNWSGGVPMITSNVVIPDAATTTNDPALPLNTAIGIIEIKSGGILNGGTSTQLTIAGDVGAWINIGGTFNPGTGTVIFTNEAATMAGETNFYNVTIGIGAELTMTDDNIMRIAGTITNNGIWRARFLENTVEYNGGGNQTVVRPNGGTGGYYHLILSNAGTKTFVTTSIAGNFTLIGSATADLTLNATTITFDGSGAQAVAAATYHTLTVAKSGGTAALSGSVAVNSDLTVSSGTLDLSMFTADRATSGGTLTIANGAMLKVGGTGTLPSNYSTHSIGSTSTVEYAGTTNTVAALNSSQSYGNLVISATGATTINSFSIATSLNVASSGSFAATGASVVTMNNNSTISNSGTLTFSGLTISNSSAVTTSSSFSVAGNFSNYGSFNATGSTIVFNGTSSQTINGTSATSFYHLISDNATGVTINSEALTTVSGTLTINAGKKLKVAAGTQLSVTGTIDNLAGNTGLILHSNASGSASLVQSTANVHATVERYVSGDAETWHFLSAPVSGQSISGSWLPSGTYSNGTGYDMYTWYEPNHCWIYQLNTSSAINWDTVHPESNFVSGRGYLYSVQEAAPTKEFAGYLNNGTVGFPLTNSSIDPELKGFNMVGNPYPSSVDWKADSGFTRDMLKLSGGGYNIWIWNPEANNYGVYNSADPTDNGTNSVGRYIAPMQGFFVQDSIAGNFEFKNAAQVHTGASAWKSKPFKIANTNIQVTVQSDAGKGSDEVKLVFGYAKNENVAQKMFSHEKTAPSLYLPDAQKSYSIRYLTDTVANPKAELSFKAGNAGNFTLKCIADETRFGVIYLEDKLTATIHNLSTNNQYSFKATSDQSPARFVLHFGKIVKDNHRIDAKVYISGESLLIDLMALSGKYQAQIFDISGRRLGVINLTGGQQAEFPLSIKGVYIVNLQSEKIRTGFKVAY